MTSVEVRRELASALKLDLVGPEDGLGSPDEVLSQAPSRWYLTGFLVPLDAEDAQRLDEDSNDEVDAAADAGGADDATPTEPASARKRFLPSSIGLSVLVPEATRRLYLRVRWGDYKRRKPADGHGDGPEWERTHRIEAVELEVPRSTRKPRETEGRPSSATPVRCPGRVISRTHLFKRVFQSLADRMAESPGFNGSERLRAEAVQLIDNMAIISSL